jgi:hypothetical protein
MLIFTAAARELVGRAFDIYGSSVERQMWAHWSAQHRDMRHGPSDPWDDRKPMDQDFRAAAVHVLSSMFDSMKQHASATMSEDQLEDLDNELAYISSVVRSIQNPPALPLHAGSPAAPGTWRAI